MLCNAKAMATPTNVGSVSQWSSVRWFRIHLLRAFSSSSFIASELEDTSERERDGGWMDDSLGNAIAADGSLLRHAALMELAERGGLLDRAPSVGQRTFNLYLSGCRQVHNLSIYTE